MVKHAQSAVVVPLPAAAPRRSTISVLVAAILSSAMAAAAAQAADTPAGDGAPQASGEEGVWQSLESIVVTASRRREPVREVPMQVSVQAAEALEREGARNLREYLANEPGVNVSTGGGGLNDVSIRGVTTGTQTSATVGVYVDEVPVGSNTAYLGGAQALDLRLLDLKNLELLRGPQGTLYGAGAMGGLLKYVTNDADTRQFFGSVRGGLSSTDEGGTSGSIVAQANVPLATDRAGLRVAASYDDVGGYVDAVGPAGGKDINRGSTKGGRVALLLTPNERLRIRLSATAQDLERDALDSFDYNYATRKPLVADLTRQRMLEESVRNKFTLYSADLEYDFGWATLNAIAAWQKVEVDLLSDSSGTLAPRLNAMLGAPLVESVAAAGQTELTKTTQELRLTSPSAPHFEWLAGLYFDQEEGENRQNFDANLFGGLTFPSVFSASLPSNYDEYAGYGDVTWKFDSGFSVTAGLRFARNEQDFTQHSAFNVPGLPASPVDLQGDSDDSSTTYLGTLRYALSPKSSVYARVASGYRPGGPNAVVPDPVTGEPLAPTTFDPDTLVSYELGYKALLADDTLSLEAAVYDIEWKDLQQYTLVNGLSVIVNAGEARVRGAELSAAWRPNQHWDVSAALAYTDAELTEDAPGLDAEAGQRLPASARLSGLLNLQYNFEVGAAGNGYVGLAQKYTGDRNVGFDGSLVVPKYVMPSYWLTDLRAGLAYRKVDVGLYARNLFDERGQVTAGTSPEAALLGAPIRVTVETPRTFGLDVTVHF